MQPSPGVGGVDRGLFVANVDDLDPLVEATVVDGHDVAARQGEDAFHPGGLEGLGGELTTVHRVTSCVLGAAPGAAAPGHPRSAPEMVGSVRPGSGPRATDRAPVLVSARCRR